jgi:hypothetical protein
MADDLTTLWQDLTLTEEESVEVIVEEKAFEEVVERVEFLSGGEGDG